MPTIQWPHTTAVLTTDHPNSVGGTPALLFDDGRVIGPTEPVTGDPLRSQWGQDFVCMFYLGGAPAPSLVTDYLNSADEKTVEAVRILLASGVTPRVHPPPEDEPPPAPATILALEAIGDDMVAFNRLEQSKLVAAGLPKWLRKKVDLSPILRKTWVAEILGRDQEYGWVREFLRGKKDYTHANSIGSRGVMVYYHLIEGPVYEVNSWKTWQSVDRYFCRIEAGDVVRMTEEEVAVWFPA